MCVWPTEDKFNNQFNELKILIMNIIPQTLFIDRAQKTGCPQSNKYGTCTLFTGFKLEMFSLFAAAAAQKEIFVFLEVVQEEVQCRWLQESLTLHWALIQVFL